MPALHPLLRFCACALALWWCHGSAAWSVDAPAAADDASPGGALLQQALGVSAGLPHQQLLAKAVNAGSGGAAVRLVQLWWENGVLASLDPRAPAMRALKDDRSAIGGVTVRQAYGDLLANWARTSADLDDDSKQQLEGEGLDLVLADPPANMTMCFEASWMAREFRHDEERATALVKAGLAAASADLVVGADPMLAKHRVRTWFALVRSQPPADFMPGVALFAEAARRCGEAKQDHQAGIALAAQASCLVPSANPAGTWSEALQLYRQARKLLAAANDEELLLNCDRSIKRCEAEIAAMPTL